VALAIVLWFIAGMSLLVAGLVYNARLDTRMTQVHVSRAKAVAAGDGAIRLMMAELVNEGLSADGDSLLPIQQYNLGGLPVEVRLLPVDGLLNLNSVDRETMAALFALAAGMGSGEALSLAENVIKWRNPSRAKGKSVMSRRKFAAVEDLLQVEGVTRSHFDALRDYLSAGSAGRGGTDWAIAGELLQQVLQQVDPERAETAEIRRARAAKRKAGGEKSKYSGARSFRADARVTYGGRTWLRRRWLKLERARNSALPWRVVRTEAPRVVQD
jgi:type II secretory pathway component PulK